MFTSNPFAELSASIPPGVMQAYVVVMVLLVVGGTLFDIIHKGSARYFFDNWRKSKNKGARSKSAAASWCRSRCRPPSSTCWPPASSATRGAGWRTCSTCTGSSSTSWPPSSWCSAIRRPPLRRRRSGRSCGGIGGADGLRRRLLVLVLHPRRRRRGRQFAVPLDDARTCSFFRCSRA